MKKLALLFSIIVLASGVCLAQTSGFTYQGKLGDGGAPANGSYDLQFTLWDAASGGTQQPQPSPVTVRRESVLVTGGIFTVPQLDFGVAAFPAGKDRWLEISVRLNGSGDAYTVLSPRQQVNSVPFAVRSLQATNANNADNATSLAGVTAGNYVQTSDTRLSDARTPTAGSTNYIQNTTPQGGTNFNVAGDGAANTFTAGTQYNVGLNRVLTVNGLGFSNTFVGVFAGIQNPSGNFNSFFGNGSGQSTTTGGNNSFYGSGSGVGNQSGSDNAFFGRNAGFGNTASQNSFFGSFSGAASSNTASGNSFFGYQSGRANTASQNSFFGSLSGESNTQGGGNAFFGSGSGDANSTGNNNAFVGYFAGPQNTSGDDNSFFGRGSGSSNVSGSFNTLIGSNADVGSGTLSNATAIGVGAIVSQNNSLVLGSTSLNTKVGIGVSAPAFKLHVVDSQNTGLRVQTKTVGGTVASFGKFGAFQIDAEPNLVGGRLTILENGNVGIGTNNPSTKLQVVGGDLQVVGGYVYIAEPNRLILKSDNGVCWLIVVDNAGGLHTESGPCP